MAKPMKKRGALLTIWLILMLLANIGAALMYFIVIYLIKYALGGGRIDLTPLVVAFPAIYVWAFYVLGIGALLNVVFTIFLFMWKKWAFFAFCGLTGIVFIINLVTGTTIVSSILGLLGPVILYLLMRPKWKFFE